MNESLRNWFIQRSKLEWYPQPIPRPAVDQDLKNLSGPQRMVEAIRFFLHSAEYWISSDGVLREWLRIMCKVFILVTCPVLLFMPTVSFALWQIALWVAFLVAIMKSLILFPLAALVAITLCGILVIVVRSLFISR